MILCIVIILFILGLSLGLWSLNISDDPQLPNSSETNSKNDAISNVAPNDDNGKQMYERDV